MPVRATAPIGSPCWTDLQTSDPERSTSFYTELFGWTAAEPAAEFGGYFMFLRDGVPVAGCMRSDEAAPVSDVWSIYLATDDVAKTLKSASAHGGQIVVPAMPVGDTGTMAFLVDAAGAGVGVWQPGNFHGFSVLAETGAPSWFELIVRDYPAASAFYRDVFGWETEILSDTDEFRYSTLKGPDGAWLAGLMDGAAHLPEGAPPHWALYMGVADTDAAVARAVELGGSVVRPAEDTEYGRIAAITDATGAHLQLVAPNEAMPAKS